MAIFKAIVRTKRKDGFYQVCIQCVHNRKRAHQDRQTCVGKGYQSQD